MDQIHRSCGIFFHIRPRTGPRHPPDADHGNRGVRGRCSDRVLRDAQITGKGKEINLAVSCIYKIQLFAGGLGEGVDVFDGCGGSVGHVKSREESGDVKRDIFADDRTV